MENPTQIFKRNCPNCNIVIEYIHKPSFDKAEESNKLCLSCIKKYKSFYTEDYIDNFQKLLAEGLFKHDIIEKLNITDEQYKYIIYKYGLKSNKATSINIINDQAKLAICSFCNLIKPLDNFELCKKKNGYTFYKTYCNTCRSQKRNEYINSDIDKFLAQRLIVIKASAKKDNLPFSLSKEDLIDQYNLQNGLCFYTDIPMIWVVGEKKNRDALSVDKIIPTNGYIKDNIVLCLNRINMAKNDLSLEEIQKWMPLWYERIQKFLMKN